MLLLFLGCLLLMPEIMNEVYTEVLLTTIRISLYGDHTFLYGSENEVKVAAQVHSTITLSPLHLTSLIKV